MSGCNNEAHGHLSEAHDRLVQAINSLALGGDVSSYLLTVDEWHSVQALGERINRLEQAQAQAAPVLAAADEHIESCDSCSCDLGMQVATWRAAREG